MFCSFFYNFDPIINGKQPFALRPKGNSSIFIPVFYHVTDLAFPYFLCLASADSCRFIFGLSSTPHFYGSDAYKSLFKVQMKFN